MSPDRMTTQMFEAVVRAKQKNIPLPFDFDGIMGNAWSLNNLLRTLKAKKLTDISPVVTVWGIKVVLSDYIQDNLIVAYKDAAQEDKNSTWVLDYGFQSSPMVRFHLPKIVAVWNFTEEFSNLPEPTEQEQYFKKERKDE